MAAQANKMVQNNIEKGFLEDGIVSGATDWEIVVQIEMTPSKQKLT